MLTPAMEAPVLRFGAFELDVRNNELRRSGVLIKLTPQQARVLRYLAERPGTVCTREDIQREIWGGEVFVDFDRSLNVSIAQIRAALNDDSEAPRFIQTVPRRGYRFVAPVESSVEPPPRRQARRFVMPAVAGLIVLVIAMAAYVWATRKANTRTMLAVLPFENVTQAAEDVPVIDGIADELITQFGTVLPDRLGVIGRTSVMRYRSRNPGLAQIARELGAGYVIEGSVRRGEGRLRVSVRLVRTGDQSQVWSETYEQDAVNRLETEEQVAARVTVAVIQALFHQNSATRSHVPDAQAYDSYVRGRYLLHKGTRADTERAIAAFEEAGARDPGFVEPWADMGQTYIGLALAGIYPAADAFGKARDSAEHALRLSEANAEAHNALADVLFWRDWNWNEAQRHFVRAIAINPSYAQAQHDYAFYQIVMGHSEDGIASLRRAIAIDPLSPRVNVDAGWVLLQAHHFDEAIQQANRALELEPGLEEAKACIARAEQYQGKADPQVLDFFRWKVRDRQASSPYNLALAYAVLGRNGEALSALEAAYRQHEVLTPLIVTEPSFAALHGDRRFQELVRRMGLLLK